MAWTSAFEDEIFKLIWNNTAAANIGDASGLQPAGTAGSIYVSLHTADPGKSGSQNTSAATYTGYAYVAVARSTAGWTVSGTAPKQVANAAAVLFPAATAGTDTITYVGIGSASSGAGHLYASFALASSLVVVTGVIPTFSVGALIFTVT